MKYTALTPIGYNGTRYEPGETIDLDDDSAKALLARGDVAPIEGEAPQAEAPQAEPEAVEAEAASESVEADHVEDFIGEAPQADKGKKRKAGE